MKIDFEQYLRERFADDYIGSQCCFEERFQLWLLKVPRENIINWADKYCKEVAGWKAKVLGIGYKEMSK